MQKQHTVRKTVPARGLARRLRAEGFILHSASLRPLNRKRQTASYVKRLCRFRAPVTTVAVEKKSPVRMGQFCHKGIALTLAAGCIVFAVKNPSFLLPMLPIIALILIEVIHFDDCTEVGKPEPTLPIGDTTDNPSGPNNKVLK